MDAVDALCELLQTHASRDKVVCVACYALKLCGATWRSDALLAASARLVAARATSRLFDDAAALRGAINYGFGRQEGVWGALGVGNNLFTLAYLQAEKVAWLIDAGLLVATKDTEYRVKTAHKLFWSLYTFFALLRSIRALHLTAQELKSAKQRKCAPARFSHACCTTTKLVLDVVHTVSWLPPGWLWGSRLSTQQASAVGAAGGALAVLLHYQAKRLSSSYTR